MKRQRAVCLVLLLALPLIACSGCGHWFGPNTHQVSVYEEFTIPPEVRGFCIVLPVFIEGKEYSFLLDTGATAVIFDQSIAHLLGEPKREITFGAVSSMVQMELFNPLDAFLGGINIGEVFDIGTADLSGFRGFYGYDVRGIIGMSVLRNYVVQIDFTKSSLIIMTSDERVHPEWGQDLPIRFNDALIPKVIALLPGNIEVEMKFDTGANQEGRLERGIFDRFKDEQHSETISYSAMGLTGVVTSGNSVIIPELRLGPLIEHDLSLSKGRDSALSLGFFSRFNSVTFDFPNSKMYLKQDDQQTGWDRPYVSGLFLKRESDCVLVQAVSNNSPAEEAGIKAGDVIVRIGEMNANDLELWEVGRLLISPHEVNVLLTIRRGEQVLEKSVRLTKSE